MMNYVNLQQYTQPLQNNYNQISQQNFNNTSTYNYPQQNYINNTNIFNNYSTPYIQQQQIFQQQPMMMQQQQMFMPQQQMMMPQQQMFMPQQQMMIPQYQQQQDNSSGFMMQLIQMLLPLLLKNNQSAVTNNQPTTIEQTEIVEDSVGVWGDPHFDAIGADGKTAVKFDQKGIVGDTYNVFQGDGYEVDARYDTHKSGYAIMGEAHIKAGADSIAVTKDGKTTINGKVIKDGSTVKLNDGTKVNVNGANTTIESRDGDGGKIAITNTDGKYLNIDPSGKMSGLGGILGTAMANNKALTEEECEKFNITGTNKKIA